MDYKEILKKLSENTNATLRSSAAYCEYEISVARSEGNFYVDENGMGFVLFIPTKCNKIETN